MNNDKSNPKEEESRSEGAVEERLYPIEDRLTKIAFGIFAMNFAITIIPPELLLPFLLFYGAGVLLVFSGLLSIIGTNYTLKKGILIENPGFWWSYSFLKKVYHYDKFSFSGIIVM